MAAEVEAGDDASGYKAQQRQVGTSQRSARADVSKVSCMLSEHRRLMLRLVVHCLIMQGLAGQARSTAYTISALAHPAYDGSPLGSKRSEASGEAIVPVSAGCSIHAVQGRSPSGWVRVCAACRRTAHCKTVLLAGQGGCRRPVSGGTRRQPRGQAC